MCTYRHVPNYLIRLLYDWSVDSYARYIIANVLNGYYLSHCQVYTYWAYTAYSHICYLIIIMLFVCFVTIFTTIILRITYFIVMSSKIEIIDLIMRTYNNSLHPSKEANVGITDMMTVVYYKQDAYYYVLICACMYNIYWYVSRYICAPSCFIIYY